MISPPYCFTSVLTLMRRARCLEAITLGMPFEVWKTRMGRFRNESTIQAFRGVYESGGGGTKGG